LVIDDDPNVCYKHLKKIRLVNSKRFNRILALMKNNNFYVCFLVLVFAQNKEENATNTIAADRIIGQDQFGFTT
jgi:hypothetical protein